MRLDVGLAVEDRAVLKLWADGSSVTGIFTCDVSPDLCDKSRFALVSRIRSVHGLVTLIHVPSLAEVLFQEPQQASHLHEVDEGVTNLEHSPFSQRLLSDRRTHVIPGDKVHPQVQEVKLPRTGLVDELEHILMRHPRRHVLDHDRRPRIHTLGDPVQVDGIARRSAVDRSRLVMRRRSVGERTVSGVLPHTSVEGKTRKRGRARGLTSCSRTLHLLRSKTRWRET